MPLCQRNVGITSFWNSRRIAIVKMNCTVNECPTVNAATTSRDDATMEECSDAGRKICSAVTGTIRAPKINLRQSTTASLQLMLRHTAAQFTAYLASVF